MITLFEIKRFFGDVVNVIFLVALPIIMLFVLGYSVDFSKAELLEMIPYDEFGTPSFLKDNGLDLVYEAKDYFGVTMLMMMSFLTYVMGANAYSEEYRLKTINRILISKFSNLRIFLEKSIGLIIVTILETACYLLVSKCLFGVNFASTSKEEVIIIGMGFLNSLCMIFLGNVLGILLRRNTLIYAMPLFAIMMIFGGTFTGSIYIKGFSDLMPIYQLQIAAFRLGTLHDAGAVFRVCCIQGILTAVFVMATFILFCRQEEVR